MASEPSEKQAGSRKRKASVQLQRRATDARVGFLDLPPEVRTSIYGHFFIGQPRLVYRTTKHSQEARRWTRAWTIGHDAVELAIWRLSICCRTTRAEVLDFTTNHIFYEVQIPPRIGADVEAQSPVEERSPEDDALMEELLEMLPLDSMRMLRLFFDVTGPDHRFPLIMDRLGWGRDLKTLQAVIRKWTGDRAELLHFLKLWKRVETPAPVHQIVYGQIALDGIIVSEWWEKAEEERCKAQLLVAERDGNRDARSALKGFLDARAAYSQARPLK